MKIIIEGAGQVGSHLAKMLSSEGSEITVIDNDPERLRALMGRGVTNETELYKKVLNDGYNLAEEVFTRSKVAKNEVLATGKMTIVENNLNISITFIRRKTQQPDCFILVHFNIDSSQITHTKKKICTCISLLA